MLPKKFKHIHKITWTYLHLISHMVTAAACASTQLWHSSRKYYNTNLRMV